MGFILTTIILYIATNIDDIFLLLTWFSQRGSSLKASHIIIGNYIGFITIVILSVVGALGALIIPQEWVGLLGFIPLYLGIKALIELYKEWKEKSQSEQEGEVHINGEALVSKETVEEPNWLQKIFHPNVYKIAAVTLSNGGDNLGVYIPFFTTYSGWQTGIIIVIFLLMNAAWCYTAYKLVEFPLVAQTLERYGHIFVPFVLIGLGILILRANGTVSYFFEIVR